MRRDGVTAMFVTAALFNQVVREVPDAFATVRHLLVGGEALDPSSIARALEHGAPERLLNGYGPTESTTFATWHRIRQVAPGTTSLPIGRPLANTTVYVLDRRHGAVPPGGAGELCIGGDGLARGYLNRPELTAERFIPHPWGSGERLYRTGDLVRLLPDGTVDFLGRLDEQVKIRGFRIEPGEVEAVLAALPEVRACAVLARRDSPGETRLVAYVVYREGAAPQSGELRSRLRERLPDYMVPAVFVTLEALPLTPNGKLDRRALPVPEAERPEDGRFEAPADPVEELLGAVWAEVLGLDRIGRDQDFFALGGHSLLATRVVSRVRAVLGVELPLRALFEAPTISSLADAVREARSAGAAEAPPIVPVPRDAAEDGLPLSFSQQRLWFLDQLEPGSSVYNVPLALRLTGELRAGLLAWAFTAVVRRHEALRTTFSSRDGRPVQVIAPALRLETPVLDLSGLAECEIWARRLAAGEARRPFDLERGPLLRLALVRLDEREHVLLLTLHHIVSDGWSMGVLLREIAALYGGRSLPELPVQYADFAIWQRRWLDLEGQLAYWRRQLEGAPRVLELPLDRPRPAMQTFRGSWLPVSLPAMGEFCRRAGATPFMVLLAAWSALLGRHVDQRDVLVGTPIAGRNRREIEGLIGFFVNTLVMRADLSGAPGFAGLLERVRQTALDAYTHQDLPFDRLVEELVPERDLSTSPLFQVMLTLQNASRQTVELPGLALSPVNVDSGMEKFDLTLALQEGPEGFAGVLGYNTDLFDGSTAARLAARFEALLEAAIEEPDLSLEELPLLLAAERHQVLAEWNDTSAPRPAGLLHELVSAQARRTPEAVAASFEDESLSYGELERRANRLAHHLIGLGVGPDDRVGVRMERSLEMIVGLLGVLKAGAAYVPLDPTYPAERLALLAESSGARAVLGQDDLSRLDAHLPEAVPVTDGNLAYVIYTSGSTGMPKGVMIPHRGIVNRLLWMQEAYPLTPDDRVLQKTPFSFDVSLGELFGPLLAGARLVFARPEGHKDPAYLAGAIVREGITSLHFVPSMLGAFLEAASDLSSVRRVLTSGEALTPELVRRFSRVADAGLLNLYGPTEASVEVSFWACDAASSTVPIGRPISNLRLHVIDREMRPQPVGVPGELLLGGVGLARGYLGRPELTAAAFVPDPFGGEGERLYRTGDLCRRLADGAVEFLGRIDHQVKVRGFRIELGEIEAVLGSHPAVRECVVLAREVLVAYVVGNAEPEALKKFLGRKLPDYMVPAVFVALDALPLTPSGKVDRRALPDPERPRSAPAEAAADPVEDLLAGLWAEVLGLDRIGRDEDFFALGGHSLLATQVVSRVRTVLGIELPLRALFESPTVSGLARVVRESRQGLPAPPIVPVPRDGRDLPLSFSQQRLWFLDQLEPASPAYNIPLAVRLTGALSIGLLGRIFAEVVRRHEALRTTFASRDGRPVQVIAPALGLELPVIDLSGLAERETPARELAAEEARRPFDLQRGPLLRLALVRLDERDHVLLLTMHHIVSDGWSMGVLLREIAALYALQGLPELPVQYADFAVWQRSWLQGEVLDGQLAYWQRQLDGVPRVLELPIDRPRPAMQTFRGSSLPVSVAAALAERLRELCRRAGVTPFMALLAAWSALLGRHAGPRDVLVGTPIAGRNRREVEALIGFFVNTLVMRADLSGAPGYGELLGRVRRAALDAYTHQDLPFDRLVEELVPERDLSTSPLFQVMLTLQNASGQAFELPGLALSPLASESGMAKFDLSLALQEGPGGIDGSLVYNTDLFDGSTAARLLARFQTLLAAAVEEPGRAVAELPLLPAAERHQVLVEWNDTSAPRPASLLHELIAAQARRTPEAIAASFEDEVLSYGELERRANRLAHHLVRRGVGVEGRVGVRMERSLEMIVGLLGVLKAGAAYVPLDPTYPAERLALLAESSGARVVLERDLLQQLDAGLPDTAPAVRVGEENLAYVLYTSGSTGTPKGVMIPHRGIVNRLLWMQEAYALTPEDRVVQKTPFSFDVSLGELFGPLLAGSRLVFARPEGHRDPLYLADLIAREQITSVHFVPSMLGAFLEVAEAFDRSSVRRVLTSGEALTPELVRRFSRTVNAELLNLSGPTAASVEVSFWACDPDASTVPIGRPISNLRLHVVDGEMRPQPVGAPGELLLGGVGLARGYLGRPDLTAGAFVPDPFGEGERLYRTGDLCRLLADGSVEFLGRIDHQVKVRGFRIELGEIESVLGSHPAVRECVVLAREDTPGSQLLVAYVVGAAEQQTLKTFLGRKLPEYMVPAAFVSLDAMPLTPSGKVGRQALPAPERPRLQPAAAAADPVDPIAELLAGIWAEVLGLDRIGAEEDFFALGGHSLLATQVVSRVRTVLGVELPLRALFESPTVSRLAREVRESREGRPAPPVVPVPRHGGDSDLPLSFAQQRLWYLDQLEPGSAAYNIPLAVRLAGALSIGLLEQIFTEVMRRHESLRTTFASRDGRPVQVIAPALGLELPVIDLSGLAERETRARELAADEARRPFDLQRGPLLRLALVRLGERDHVLLLTMHHIVSDGWSMGVLLREIAALHAFQSLPELPVQYADFAVWQRSWLQGEVLETQLDYWRHQLAGTPRVLELPLDRPRPAVQTFRGASRAVALPPRLSEAVYGLCRRQSATPFMALLAAWAVVLGRHAGQEDVLLGTPIAGRNRREIEGLIGFFVNTLALRADLSGAPGFGELLGRVRQAALDGYTHQDVPFERLVEELVPERDLSYSPLFQAMFVLQNAVSGPGLSLPGLSLTPLAAVNEIAKLDLTLTLMEQGERVFVGDLEHNVDLFDGSTAERLWARFTALLEGALAGPLLSLSELPLLLPEERQQALLEWNDTARDYASGLCLHDLVARQAQSTPDRVAVSFSGQELSYAELDRRANRLAQALIGLEVEPDGRVGVLAERSLEMVVGLLGVLKAGAAYVPLDPTYPAGRLALLAESSGARVVLVQDELAHRLPGRGERIVSLDHPVAGPDGLPVARAGEDNLAYVIYTSGSTGTPKGVMVPHRGVVNRLVWGQEVYRLGPADAVLQKAPFSFDISVWELFAPLIAGARLVVAEPEGHRDAAYLARTIAEHGVTMVDFVPALLGVFLEEPGLESCTSLRQVFTGGDTLSPALRDRFLERLGRSGVRLDNQYGPTEASIDTARWICRPGTVSIGRPVANTRLYVTDGRLGLQPPGVAGELAIGGVGLARGYLDRPDLTAAAFVPDPSGTEAGGRLYRTGDLCRLLPDGGVEFLGRIDHQVKIRGLRIELGEIEAALGRHPDVRETVVLAREPHEGAALVGYVVADEIHATAAELRRFLGERLPVYMVPSAFVFLNELPLTTGGKVDRNALSASALPERTRDGERLAPRDVLELRLVRLWEELLGIQPVGVQDDFFELGGHSLLAVQLVAGIQKSFGRTLPLAALLRNPTVERLAAVLREGGDPARGVLVELAPGTGRPFFCVHAVGGEVLSYVSLARQLEVDRPVFGIQAGLQAQGDATVEEMAARYVQAIREVQPEGPYSLGGWSMGGVVAFEMACQLERQGEAVEPVVLIDSLAPGRTEERVVQDGELVALFAHDVARLFGLGLPPLPSLSEGFEDLNTEDALRWLSAEAERAGILPAGAGSGEVQRRFKVFQANFRALESYSGGPCAALVILFKAAETVRPEVDLGWSRLSRGPVEVHALPGDHYTLLQPPHVQALAARLRERLL
ncbi:MAG TPA: amino acid adenylation domain-containing protein [Thermoanaerobaculia bacterium]|nr:amino acid adenylation domain-containing protein [Thermoanaerobaculia bacterium]